MNAHVVRVWLPDRPGALGAVASRIGAVRGDVVGIEILERAAHRAIDELVVLLPPDVSETLLVNEIMQVDGVDVESIRPTSDPFHDHLVAGLEIAGRLVDACTPGEVLVALCRDSQRLLDAEWAILLSIDDGEVRFAVGPVPPTAWLMAFIEGSKLSGAVASGAAGPDDVAWSHLERTGLDFVLCRGGRPLRAAERRQLSVLAAIADARMVELKR